MNPPELSRELPIEATAKKVSWLYLSLILIPLAIFRIHLSAQPPFLHDFITYWASGHLFLAGGEPYSGPAIFALERAQGWDLPQPMVLLCPPWTLPAVALMALLPFRLAQMSWYAASLLLNALSSLGLWTYFGGARKQFWIPLLIALTFIPMGGAEVMGQITPLILLCLTGFLLALKSKRHFAAGVLLVGLGFKPHLLYLVLLAILLWTLEKRVSRIFFGAIAAYGTVTAATILFNRNTLGYFRHSYSAAIETPCGIGYVLRSFFGLQHAWLQFVPSLIGLAWFVRYWMRHRRHWDWPTHLPLLLIVSVCTSPYCWYHDFILILPALVALAIHGAYRKPFVPAAYFAVQATVVFAFNLSMAWMCVFSLLWIPFYLTARANRFRFGAIPRQHAEMRA